MEQVKSIRFHELAGLRGLAALTVYFSHLLGSYNISGDFFNYLDHSPFHIFWHGEGAVQLFFILSSFVLTLPYMKNTETLTLSSFYAKRVLRIYPVFFCAILFSLILKETLFNEENMKVYSPWINLFWKWNLSDYL